MASRLDLVCGRSFEIQKVKISKFLLPRCRGGQRDLSVELERRN